MSSFRGTPTKVFQFTMFIVRMFDNSINEMSEEDIQFSFEKLEEKKLLHLCIKCCNIGESKSQCPVVCPRSSMSLPALTRHSLRRSNPLAVNSLKSLIKVPPTVYSHWCLTGEQFEVHQSSQCNEHYYEKLLMNTTFFSLFE